MAEEQQEQQRSSVDRVNDLINKAQSVRGNYKKAKGAYNAFKAARAARTAATAVQGAQAVGGAAATSPVWGTAAVIILIIILIIILFIIVFAGGQNVKGGAGGVGTYECPVACQKTACTGTDIPDTNATCSPTTDICCVPEPPPGTQPPIRFYCQYDDAWETSTCKINQNGCTPTSVAMILASYGNPGINPLNTALANTRNRVVGAGCFAGGSSAYDFIPWIKRLGYTVGPDLAGGTTFDVVKAKEFISKGYFLLSGANILFNRSLSSGGPHAFVIGNIDSANIATVYDPTFCSTDTDYSIRKFSVFGFGGANGSPSQPLLSNHRGNYWFTVFPIKKL